MGTVTCGAYCMRVAQANEDLTSVFRLRYTVFNLELNEGLEAAHKTGLDRDQFDAVCDHLVVEHGPTRQVVGTYRLQTGITAARNLGYYSAREFDFSPYEPLRDRIVELGRACIHRDHRSFEVLSLLWRGIAQYANRQGARYLVGCSSLTSQDPAEGDAMYRHLKPYLAEPGLRSHPVPGYELPKQGAMMINVHPPRLLRAYLSIGARIAGPPAIDREFGTIDFLTLLDLDRMSSAARARFLEG
ncbi:MAG: GNAT family N-acetyltransferase [Acidobacteriales bacterium]|nr:GNAT family N-acetyltransferase [Terriglobales bacterium]